MKKTSTGKIQNERLGRHSLSDNDCVITVTTHTLSDICVIVRHCVRIHGSHRLSEASLLTESEDTHSVRIHASHSLSETSILTETSLLMNLTD